MSGLMFHSNGGQSGTWRASVNMASIAFRASNRADDITNERIVANRFQK